MMTCLMTWIERLACAYVIVNSENLFNTHEMEEWASQYVDFTRKKNMYFQLVFTTKF
jgi:hypothetical protein